MCNYGLISVDFDMKLQYKDNNFTKSHSGISPKFENFIAKSTGRTEISTIFVWRFREDIDRIYQFLEESNGLFMPNFVLTCYCCCCRGVCFHIFPAA